MFVFPVFTCVFLNVYITLKCFTQRVIWQLPGDHLALCFHLNPSEPGDMALVDS